MKIKTKPLTTFLTKVKMAGTQQITECILKFESEGLKIGANSDAQLSRVAGVLNKSLFKDYVEIGNVGVNDFDNVIKVIQRFGETLTLKKEGNLLTLSSGGKKVDIELVSEDFIKTDVDAPELEFDETFTISSKQLGDIITDVQMNKDAVLSITTEEKKVKFNNTGKYKFENEIDALTVKGGTKVDFGQPFIDAVSGLTGSLEMSLKVDYPCKIVERTDDSIITIVVAPRVSDE